MSMIDILYPLFPANDRKKRLYRGKTISKTRCTARDGCVSEERKSTRFQLGKGTADKSLEPFKNFLRVIL